MFWVSDFGLLQSAENLNSSGPGQLAVGDDLGLTGAGIRRMNESDDLVTQHDRLNDVSAGKDATERSMAAGNRNRNRNKNVRKEAAVALAAAEKQARYSP